VFKLTRRWVPDGVAIEHFQMSPNPLELVGNLLSLTMFVAGIRIGSISD
jgi:hypothetical protein